MTTTRHRVLAPLTLAAALALTACNQGGQAEFESGDQPSANEQAAPAATEDDTADAQDDAAGEDASAAETDAAEEDGEAGGQDASSPAGVNPATVPDAIATVTVPARVNRDKDATLDVSIHSLTREGKTVMGVFSFTLNSTADDDGRLWLYDVLGSQSWAPHFIDTQNLARHDVLRKGSTKAITDSQGSTYVRPGQTLYGYAAFAAPPEDVTSVMVSLTDGTQAVEVPIQ